MSDTPNFIQRIRTGWRSRFAQITMGLLAFEVITGLAITFGPFSATVQWGVLAHTLAGIIMLLPVCWYSIEHWLDYRERAFSDVVLLGYVTTAGLLVVYVEPATPAAEAGLQAGDVIQSIDGKPISALNRTTTLKPPLTLELTRAKQKLTITLSPPAKN